jgi:hypothetical protein
MYDYTRPIEDDLYEPTSDYDDQMEAIRLGYQDHDSSYCEHGTFVGNWAGPDYMCAYCEMGVTVEELERDRARDELRRARVRALRPKLMPLIEACNEAARIDPASPEALRLFKRLTNYIHWRVQPPDVIGDMAREVHGAS